MDPRDQLRPLLDGVGCTVCGSPVPAERIRILAHRDDLAFVELSCPGCGSTTLAMLQAADDADGLVSDLAAFGELTPADEARRLGTGPITGEDVRAARAFLAKWNGDLVGLLGGDEPDRRDPPATR
jgi:hypothetical protein